MHCQQLPSSMHAVNDFVQGNCNYRIHTLHFVHLRPHISFGSTAPQKPTAPIPSWSHPKIKWVSPGGPSPALRISSPLMSDCERADAMWDASPGLTSIWSLLPKYLPTFLKISIWKKTGTSRSQEHKWLGCPDPRGAPDFISKYMSSFTPWHKVVTLHCWTPFFFFYQFFWQPHLILGICVCCWNSFKKHSVWRNHQCRK